MVAVAPTTFLKDKLDPVSHQIDGFGGPHVLLGLIAAGGEPHIYIVGNVHGNLKDEIYEALGDKLKSMVSNKTPKLITGEGIVL